MRVLILGGGGQVAGAVARVMTGTHEVFVRSRAEVDITDAESLGKLLAHIRADWVVNGAAYTAVDRAEDESARAVAINDTAVGTLAAAVSRARARLLHLSTDFVFDGKANRAYLPNDPPNPLSVYGATKLAGEKKALDAGCAAIVLRTAWVYAATGKNFVLTMLKLMSEREQLRVVADQIGTPSWATGIACAIRDLLGADAPAGLYHWTDLGVASWYDFAVAIQDEALERSLLKRAVPIIPIATWEYPTRAVRPAFSVLDSKATRDLIAAPAVHWRHNLRRMLDELRAA
jgi:dTDP-4-dehydrorhamnose reductase